MEITPYKIKVHKLMRHFVAFNRAKQEIIQEGEEFGVFVLHDVTRDLENDEFQQMISANANSQSKELMLKSIVALNTLPEEDRMIIDNELIHRKDRLWYEEYYSRSQYYRRRKLAFERLYDVIF